MLHNVRLMQDYLIAPHTNLGFLNKFSVQKLKNSRNPRMQSMAQLGTDSFLKV